MPHSDERKPDEPSATSHTQALARQLLKDALASNSHSDANPYQPYPYRAVLVWLRAPATINAGSALGVAGLAAIGWVMFPGTIGSILGWLAILAFLSMFSQGALVSLFESALGPPVFNMLYRRGFLGLLVHTLFEKHYSFAPPRLPLAVYPFGKQWLSLAESQRLITICEEAGIPPPKLLCAPRTWTEYKDELTNIANQLAAHPERLAYVEERAREKALESIAIERCGGFGRFLEEEGYQQLLDKELYYLKMRLADLAEGDIRTCWHVVTPRFRLRFRANRYRLPVSELVENLKDGTAFMAYFPYGYRGWGAPRALSPRSYLRLSGRTKNSYSLYGLPSSSDSLDTWHPDQSGFFKCGSISAAIRTVIEHELNENRQKSLAKWAAGAFVRRSIYDADSDQWAGMRIWESEALRAHLQECESLYAQAFSDASQNPFYGC